MSMRNISWFVLIAVASVGVACAGPDPGGEVRLICVSDACLRAEAQATDPAPAPTSDEGASSSSSSSASSSASSSSSSSSASSSGSTAASCKGSAAQCSLLSSAACVSQSGCYQRRRSDGNYECAGIAASCTDQRTAGLCRGLLGCRWE